MLGSFLSFTAASLLQIFAMKMSYAADGSFILAMEPLLVILLAVIFLKEKLDPKMLGGLVLAMVGFMYLSNESVSTQPMSGRWMGNLIFLLAVFAEASFPVFLKPLLKHYPPLVVAFYSLLCASFYMLPFQNLNLLEKIPQLNLKTLGAVTYLGLGCSFLACFLWLKCLARFNASFVALSWFVQPLFGCLFACLVIQETLSPNIWVGGSFIFAALALLAAPGKEKKAAMKQTMQEIVMRIKHPMWDEKPLTPISLPLSLHPRKKRHSKAPHFPPLPRRMPHHHPVVYH